MMWLLQAKRPVSIFLLFLSAAGLGLAQTTYEDPQGRFVVHLPTGKRADTILSPHYLSYGLWQIVDFEKGVVCHSNIGMDPSRYELSDSRAYCPYKNAKTVQTFLIAQPVKIPR
jgi:hypothetical protein